MHSAAVALLALAAIAAVSAQTNQCHYDCYNFKGPVSDGEALKSASVMACKSNNVVGNPTFASGPQYFQSNSNTAPEQGCTFSSCTPFMGGGYGTQYVNCEHATAAWKALTDPSNTTSSAARTNANVPCTACPTAS